MSAATVVSSAFGVGGDPDPGFGEGGKVTTSAGAGIDSAYDDLTLGPGGDATAVGHVRAGGFSTSPSGANPDTDFLIGRYTRNGELDPSFGEEGISRVDLSPVAFVNSNDEAFGVSLQADGKVVVVGHYSEIGDVEEEAGIARLNADGTPDATFGNAGTDRTDVLHGGNPFGFDTHNAVVIDANGRAVAAGFSENFAGQEFAQITRYQTDGDPAPGSEDPAFGASETDGVAIYDFGNPEDDRLFDLAIRPDGKIVAGGFTTVDGIRRFALIQANGTDGTIDGAFGANGVSTVPFGDEPALIRGIELLGNGKIVVAGSVGDDVAIARFDEAGSLDASFGTGGVARFNGAGSADDLAVNPDGALIAIGTTSSSPTDWLVAMVDSTGAPVSDLGGEGVLTFDFAGMDDQGLGIEARESGHLVGAGVAGGSTNAAMGQATPIVNDVCRKRDATILGTEGDDEIDGTAGDDVIITYGGDDAVDGGGGNDRICLGPGNDSGTGEGGRDLIFGDTGSDVIDGGGERDGLFGSDGNDRIIGASHSDRIQGGGDADNLIGGSGDDKIRAGGGDDDVDAGVGGDVVEGLEGDDEIQLGPGDDRGDGTEGNDRLDGADGDDRLRGFLGRDKLSGGPGNDRGSGGNGPDRFNGGAGNDDIRGRKGNDKLSGGGGDDFLRGDEDADKLQGEDGNDRLQGGLANDLVDGGGGRDVCKKGPGNEKHRSCETIR